MVQARKQSGGATRLSIDGLLDPALFRALSDPTRLRLLAALAGHGRPCGVGEIAEGAGVDLSVVSRHLSALADAGVLQATKQGRRVSYQVRFSAMADMFRALAGAISACCPGGCCGGACNCGCPCTGPGRSGASCSSAKGVGS
ncbi:MAG: winged helix-turn-helix transcriptional regulator [Phycisphaerales bacterium]|nr:winged helix-turn-helix transcriptional regulator [Phycisphaerales bacterium]